MFLLSPDHFSSLTLCLSPLLFLYFQPLYFLNIQAKAATLVRLLTDLLATSFPAFSATLCPRGVALSLNFFFPFSTFCTSCKGHGLIAQQLRTTNSFLTHVILFASRTLRLPHDPLSIDKIGRRTSSESFRVWSQFQSSYELRASIFWLCAFHYLSSNATDAAPPYLFPLSWY